MALEVYERIWKCPKCGGTCQWSYKHLAKHGTPICDMCNTEMELQPEE